MRDKTFLEIKEALARTGFMNLNAKDIWYLIEKVEELDADLFEEKHNLRVESAALNLECERLEVQNKRLTSRGFEDLHDENEQLKATLERVRAACNKELAANIPLTGISEFDEGRHHGRQQTARNVLSAIKGDGDE